MTEVIFNIEDENETAVFIKMYAVPRVGEIVNLTWIALSDFCDPETAEEDLKFFRENLYFEKSWIVQKVAWTPISPHNESSSYVNIFLIEQADDFTAKFMSEFSEEWHKKQNK